MLYQVLKQRSQTEMETFSLSQRCRITILCGNLQPVVVRFFSCFHSQGGAALAAIIGFAGASPEVGMLQLTSRTRLGNWGSGNLLVFSHALVTFDAHELKVTIAALLTF